MLKRIRVKEPLSNFLGIEKISGIEALLSSMRRIASKDGLRTANVFFPRICDLEVNYSSWGRHEATIEISKKNRINPAMMIGEMVSLIQSEYEKDTEKSIFINMRYQKHAAQFLNGHLEKDKKGKAKPMHTIYDPRDHSFIKTLKTYVTQEEKIVDGKLKIETIEDLLESNNIRKNDVIEGPLSQIWSMINRKKTEEEVARTLGFNVVTKDSESTYNGKKDRCPAVRTCIHTEEISWDDLAAKVVETYSLMKKLRKDPSYLIGISDVVDIHVDSHRITMSTYRGANEKVYATFLSKILQLVGITDFDSASVQYIKESSIEDPFVLKAKDALIETGYDVGGILRDFFAAKKVRSTIVFLVLLFGMWMSTALILRGGYSLLETEVIMLPAYVLLVLGIRNSKEKEWIDKIGRFWSIWYPGLVLYWSYLIYPAIGLKGYTDIYVFIAIVAIAVKLAERYGSDIVESKALVIICQKLEALFEELSSNRIANVIYLALAVITGVMIIVTFGILAIALLIPLSAALLFAALMDRKFREEYSYEKERYRDRFFFNFKKERPELTEACRIKLKLSRCPKLLIWIPLKVFVKELIEYGQKKYPRFLTLANLKKRGLGIVEKVGIR